MNNLSKWVSVSIMTIALAAGCGGGKSRGKLGACEMAYDEGIDQGVACTEVQEYECKASALPDIHPSGGDSGLTRKAFTPGARCARLGYTTRGCSEVAIAWSFDGGCP